MIPYDVWAEIDLNAIANNIKGLKSLLDKKTGFMAVVKADAYGHGAVETALCAIEAGADMLGVARLEEALELRHAGIDVPVLIFGHTHPRHARKLMDYRLVQSVFSYQGASELSERGAAAGNRIMVHVKIDTGMGRLGIPVDRGGKVSRRQRDRDDAVDEIRAVSGLEGLAVKGAFTHFASADEADKSMALRQLDLFNDITAYLANKGVSFEMRHCSNSAALIDLPETHMDMVRAGISIYGYYPSMNVNRSLVKLYPAMTLKSRIVQLKNVDVDFPISYGAIQRTERKTTIASVAVGYADGLSRLLSARGMMTVGNCNAPIKGRVCMDTTMIDVGHISDIVVNDEVIIFGDPDNGVQSADFIAEQIGTISYEVLTGVSRRVPRIYIR